MQTSSPRPSGVDDLDLGQIFVRLWRYAPLLLVLTVLAAAVTFLVSDRRPSSFEAVSSIIAADQSAQNSIINNTLVTAPPLPPGAVEEVLHSSRVVESVIAKLQASKLPRDLVQKMSRDLRTELADNLFGRLKIAARLDQQQRGVYEIRATAESPEAARVLASAGVRSLLEWDAERAQAGVARSRRTLQAQLNDLNARIAATPPNSVDRQSLLAARGQLVQNLSQAAVLESAATGTLTLVAEPVAPRRAVAPRPGRDAAFAGILTLVVASGLMLLFENLRRRVASSEDLAGLGFPVLGQLPLLRRRQMAEGFVSASRAGRLYESVGFLRINITSLPNVRGHRRIVVSSAHPGEGKSSVTAALAESLAATGQRVLVIDADLRRPTQLKVWAPATSELRLLPGAVPSASPATTISAALLNPDGARATAVSSGVDLLPAGSGLRGGAATTVLTKPLFRQLIDRWSEGYDVVLIDTPPMLSLPDTLAVAPFADGIVIVVESGKTRMNDVERALANAGTANARVLGFVLNKVSGVDRAYYGYPSHYAGTS